MDILERIIAHKRQEVAQRQTQTSVQILEKSPLFSQKTNSLQAILQQKSGIIAEFKLKSPSKPMIRHSPSSPIERETLLISIAQQYTQGGAVAISVLTDETFFGGNAQDLRTIRTQTNLPLLRKDFIIHEYQIIEAKSWGADIILLIAACLSPKEVAHLAHFAQKLGLEVLLEVHTQAEVEMYLNPYININFVGVNNRNLQTFVTDIQTSITLAPHIPAEFIKISESGLEQPRFLPILQQHGFKGFLIGETFMRTEQPQKILAEFAALL